MAARAAVGGSKGHARTDDARTREAAAAITQAQETRGGLERRECREGV